MSGGKIRVLIVDDHTIVRAGLRRIVDAEPDMEAVGEAASGEEAVEKARALSPDVVIMDLKMRGIGGVEATREVKRVSPSSRVLVLTMFDDLAYLRRAVESGASGYLLKEAADQELIRAIRMLHRGGSYLDPVLGGQLAHSAAAAGRRGPPTPLSPREKEILRLLALGYTQQQIADELFLSRRTVEAHKSHIYQKLGLRSRAELVRYAIEHGLVEFSPEVSAD